MNTDEIIKTAFAFIASLGGAGALILVISKYFGDLFAKRYEQKLISNFQREINEYQNKLDIVKRTTLRYSDKQFELYSNLWSSLQNLKISADNLWEKASARNLSNFSRQLRLTKNEIEKSSLFIEDSHYNELIRIIRHFSEFQIGKKMLIDYRQNSHIDEHLIEDQMIAGNHRVKKEYDELIIQIKDNLKQQLKGE